ncbi:MAG TPA: CHAD domain-containing protein [Terriglobales bacterium]
MASIGTNSLPVTGVARRQSQFVFDRLARYSHRLSKRPTPETVHHFRTNSRRVETLITDLAPESHHKKKTLKLISKLRKKAGKVRDLDVQLAFLNDLKMPDRQNHRSQLSKTLAEEHAYRSAKLAKLVNSVTTKELRKRLRRESAVMNLDGIDPLRLAYTALPNPGHAPMSEKALHSCRIAARRARYLAELAGEAHEAKFFVEQLKHAQDAIGEWHDVLKLKQKAEERFGSASDSALVSMLQNISRSRFRGATNSLFRSLANLSERRQAKLSFTPLDRKFVASDVAAQRAAVA